MQVSEARPIIEEGESSKIINDQTVRYTRTNSGFPVPCLLATLCCATACSDINQILAAASANAAICVPPQVQRDAISAAEQDGIVFLDEIDKIVTTRESYGKRSGIFHAFMQRGLVALPSPDAERWSNQRAP